MVQFCALEKNVCTTKRCAFVILINSVFTYFLILLYLCVLVNCAKNDEYYYRVQNSSWTPINSTRKLTLKQEHKPTLFVGYSHNPFGASKKINIKEKRNLTKSLIVQKSQKNKTKNFDDSNNMSNMLDPMDEIDVGITKDEVRSKRGVLQLYNMVVCATGCNPLIYKGYGCYCGFLGSGYAVDGIDRCCKIHDWCYDTTNCPVFLDYFVPYFWKCYRRKPLCAIENGAWGGGLDVCAQRLCECDRALSECLSQYPCPRKRALCYSSPLRLFQNAFMLF